jgi:hypothetical protein
MIIMKKRIVIVLCAVMALILVACGSQSSVNNSTSQADEQEQIGMQILGGAQIPNPFVDCKTLREAQEVAGFDIALPEKMPKGYSQSAIRAVKNTMIEIIYNNGNEKIRIRKGTGSEDISGAYNEYSETDTVIVGNFQVTMKGSGGKVNVAVWFNEGYAFAVTINLVGAGMAQTAVSDMVNSVK